MTCRGCVSLHWGVLRLSESEISMISEVAAMGGCTPDPVGSVAVADDLALVSDSSRFHLVNAGPRGGAGHLAGGTLSHGGAWFAAGRRSLAGRGPNGGAGHLAGSRPHGGAGVSPVLALGISLVRGLGGLGTR